MAPGSCKNHSDKTATYRCYQCKTGICFQCRLHLDHHYFCSHWCFLKYKMAGIYEKTKPYAVRILFAFQILIIFYVVGIYLHFQQKIEPTPVVLEKSPEDSTHIVMLRAYLNSDLFRTSREGPTIDSEIADHTYQINLKLHPASIVNIWRNNNPIISEQPGIQGDTSIPVPLVYGHNRLQVVVLDPENRSPYRQTMDITYRNPEVELFRRSIRRGNIHRKRIAITFDAGSDDSNTREILQILSDHRITCTLFLTGKFMEQHPDLVRKMLEDGHEIANHTYDHPRLTTYEQNYQHQILPDISRAFIHRQLLQTDSIYYSLTGRHLEPYWRAPYGEYNDRILTWAAEAGFMHISWTGSFDTHDWVTDESSSLFKTPDEIYDSIMTLEQEAKTGLNGVIVLMHLGSQRKDNHAYEVLPRLIRTIRDKGYVPGKISDLLY